MTSEVSVKRYRCTAARCVSCSTVVRGAWVHEIVGDWVPNVLRGIHAFLCDDCRRDFADNGGATRAPYWDFVQVRGRKLGLGVLTPPTRVAPDVGAILLVVQARPDGARVLEDLKVDRARVLEQLRAHQRAAKPGVP